MSAKREAYLCLSAMLRAREPKLLNNDRAARMLDAASFEEAAKLLTDSGYADMSQMNAKEIEAYLTSRREEIFAELEKLAPDKIILDVFKMKYDYHNAKVIIKAEAMGQDAKRLMSASGRIAPDKLLEIYNEDKISQLPAAFGEALSEAKSTLARTANPSSQTSSLTARTLPRSGPPPKRSDAPSSTATQTFSPTAPISKAPCAPCAWARIWSSWTPLSSPAAA